MTKFSQIALQEGLLISLNISCWGNETVMKDSELGDKLPPEIVRGKKRLIDQNTPELREIKEIHNQAKRFLLQWTSPWVREGFRFIHKSRVEMVSKELERLSQLSREALERFLPIYEIKREEEMKLLKKLFEEGKSTVIFDERKYPSPTRMREKYGIYYSLFQLTVPVNMIPKAIYQIEQDKLKAEFEEAGKLGTLALRKSFAEVVLNLKNRIQKGQKFKDSSVEKLKEIVSTFQDLNVWQDAELNKIIDSCKKELNIENLDAEAIRKDEAYQKQTLANLNNIVTKVKNLGDDELLRQIDF